MGGRELNTQTGPAIYATVLDLYQGTPCLRTDGRDIGRFSFPGVIRQEIGLDDEFVVWWWPNIAVKRDEVLFHLGWGSVVGALSAETTGCHACVDSVQPGHYACWSSTDVEKAIERAGYAQRVYTGNSWKWASTQKPKCSDCRYEPSFVVVWFEDVPGSTLSTIEAYAEIKCMMHRESIVDRFYAHPNSIITHSLLQIEEA